MLLGVCIKEFILDTIYQIYKIKDIIDIWNERWLLLLWGCRASPILVSYQYNSGHLEVMELSSKHLKINYYYYYNHDDYYYGFIVLWERKFLLLSIINISYNLRASTYNTIIYLYTQFNVLEKDIITIAISE